jgi:hypothetical protein
MSTIYVHCEQEAPGLGRCFLQNHFINLVFYYYLVIVEEWVTSSQEKEEANLLKKYDLI